MRNKTDYIKEEIINFYCIDKLTTRQIGEKFNLSKGTISKCLKDNNIQLRESGWNQRKYDLDFGYFEKIDTVNKAQILGFVYADGCLEESRKSLTIGLCSVDKDYLEFIKSDIKYTGPIRDSNYDNKFQSKLSISSEKMYQDLLNIGLTPRKSLTIDFPQENKVSKSFYSHFLRGYIEGDGSIILSKDFKGGKFLSSRISMCGTLQFLTTIKNFIKTEFDIHCYISQKKQQKERNINCHSLAISGNNQVVKILEWLYKDANYVMQRKFDKFLQFREDLKYREDHKEELSAEKSRKQSAKLKGRIVSQETRKRMSDYQQKVKFTKYKEVWAQKDGIIYHIRGIKPFCEEVGINWQTFCSAMNPNIIKVQSCHGWTRYNFDSANPPINFIKKFY